MAAEVKERMDECVARRRGAVAHWHGGMENRKRSHGEGQERKKMEGGKVFKKVGDRGEDRCERTMGGGEEGKKTGRMHGCVKMLKQVEERGELKKE